MDADWLLSTGPRRVAALDSERRRVVVTACIARLRRRVGHIDRELDDAIAVLNDPTRPRTDHAAAAATLEARDEVDDDLVAATIYALHAVSDRRDDAWWVVSRFVESTFAQANDQGSDFRPLAEDAADPDVEPELLWLDRLLEGATTDSE